MDGGFSVWLIAVIFMSWIAVKPAPQPPPVPPAPPRPVPVPQPQPVQPPKLKETFVLLPDAEGKTTGIVIKTKDREIAVTEPFHGVELTGGNIVNKELTAEQVRQQFPEVMQVLPEKPRTFILHFERKAKLTAESLAIIGDIRQEIAKHVQPEITVIGHTDRIGSAEDNLRLSLRRAEEVRNALVEGGVPEERIQVVGRGELDPAVATEDEIAEPLNRRVEVIVR